MKKLIAAACCAAVLSMSIGAVSPAAAGSSQEEGTEAAAASAETEENAPVKRQIGEKVKGALKARLTNATKKDIKAFEIKKDTEEEFGENMLAEGEVLARGEIGVVYYSPEDSTADEEEEAVYVIRLTFADDTTAELHEFSFSKMKKAKIRLKEGTAYVVYWNEGEKVSTLKAEQELAGEAQAAVENDSGVLEYDDYYEDTYYDDTSYDSSYDNSSSGDDSSYDNSGSGDDSSYDNSGSGDDSSYDDSSSGGDSTYDDSGSGDGGSGGDDSSAEENCLVGGLMN